MSKRTAARFLAAGLLGLSLSGIAYGQGGHSGQFGGSGGFHHFAGSGGFHQFDGGHHFDGRFQHFDGHHFGSRIIIGGPVFVPFDYPPPPDYYYAPPPMAQYVEPNPAPSAPQPSWFYCPDSMTYYPYVQQCASGWQPVAPQPPS